MAKFQALLRELKGIKRDHEALADRIDTLEERVNEAIEAEREPEPKPKGEEPGEKPKRRVEDI